MPRRRRHRPPSSIAHVAVASAWWWWCLLVLVLAASFPAEGFCGPRTTTTTGGGATSRNPRRRDDHDDHAWWGHHAALSSSNTALSMLKVERYVVDDGGGGGDDDDEASPKGRGREEEEDDEGRDGDDGGDGDEGLFAALMNDKVARVRAAEEAALRASNATLGPEEIVPLMMDALGNNDVPSADAGLGLVWAFATDTTKFIFKSNVTDFIESCHETADEFPTSFYGSAMDGVSWSIESPINRVGGDDGWIATQVTKTVSSDGRLRRWQWELRKNRRPPDMGCWRIESIGSSDRNGEFVPREGDGWSD